MRAASEPAAGGLRFVAVTCLRSGVNDIGGHLSSRVSQTWTGEAQWISLIIPLWTPQPC
jgi:hypothetical protein